LLRLTSARRNRRSKPKQTNTSCTVVAFSPTTHRKVVYHLATPLEFRNAMRNASRDVTIAIVIRRRLTDLTHWKKRIEAGFSDGVKRRATTAVPGHFVRTSVSRRRKLRTHFLNRSRYGHDIAAHRRLADPTVEQSTEVVCIVNVPVMERARIFDVGGDRMFDHVKT